MNPSVLLLSITSDNPAKNPKERSFERPLGLWKDLTFVRPIAQFSLSQREHYQHDCRHAQHKADHAQRTITDVFGGNRAGALTCYVETLDRRFFWINVRYQLERGFIARGRRRMEARAHHG